MARWAINSGGSAKRGAEVVLITGPTALNPPRDVEVIRINTTVEMFNAVEEQFDTCRVLIKAAAPLDYKPEKVSDVKIKKKKKDKKTN